MLTKPPGTPAEAPVVGWPLVAAAAVAAVGVLVFHVVAVPLDNPFYGLFRNYADLAIYRAGGDAVVHRTGVYDGPILFGMQFTYTPFAAIVFAPLALLTQSAANVVWWSATFLALAATVALSFKSLGYRLDRRVGLLSVLLAVAATALEPVRTTVWLGQVNVFLMLLVLWDLTRPDGSRLRGVGVGVATGIKLTPGFFLVYLAVTRQWRSCVTALGALAATVAVGFAAIPGDALSYWTGQFRSTERVGPVDAPSNQSVNGVLGQLLRFYDVARYSNPDNAGVFEPPTWMWLLFAVPAVALGVAAARVAHRREHELLAVVLTGMTAATVSPFSWGHHWVWFVPLFVLALHFALTSAARLRWLVPVAAALPALTWWHPYPDRPGLHGAEHPIGIGLFMMPIDPDRWWAHLLAPVYAGCYPLAFAVVAASTLLVRPRGAVDGIPLPAAVDGADPGGNALEGAAPAPIRPPQRADEGEADPTPAARVIP